MLQALRADIYALIPTPQRAMLPWMQAEEIEQFPEKGSCKAGGFKSRA
jgi:hypothetical protein